MSELKPCPFCGSTNVRQYGGGLSQESKTTICSNCFAQVAGHELWNNRPLENKIKADAVREFLDSVSDTSQLSSKNMKFLDKFVDVYFGDGNEN